MDTFGLTTLLFDSSTSYSSLIREFYSPVLSQEIPSSIRRGFIAEVLGWRVQLAS